MKRSATILATIGLGAMLATGTATVSMARGGGGHGGGGHIIHGGGHGFGGHHASTAASVGITFEAVSVGITTFEAVSVGVTASGEGGVDGVGRGTAQLLRAPVPLLPRLSVRLLPVIQPQSRRIRSPRWGPDPERRVLRYVGRTVT